jgi:NIMA (never in mitosis gene a)-related kinase
MEPSQVKDFDVIKQLGRGSYGSTYLVNRKLDNNNYCLKRISIREMSRKDQESAINEARFLALLRSNYIIQYYDSFIENSCLFIIMEYAEGGTLHDYMKSFEEKGKIPEMDVWRLLLETAIGLQR